MKYALIAAIEGDRKNLNNDNFYFRFFKYTLCW